MPGPSTNPTQQALPSAVVAIQARPGSFASPQFACAGAVDLTAPTNPDTLLSKFFASAGGTASTPLPSTPLSDANGSVLDETLIKFTLTVGAISGSIFHDDGVSLFASGDAASNLTLALSSAPTSVISTAFNLAGGTYDLYCSEVNGASARLTFDVTSGNPTTVPEPVSMALVDAGLLGIGLMRRTSHQG